MALEGRDPYGFDPAFERALVTLLCSVPKVFGKVGRDLDSELLSGAAPKLAVEAAQAIALDLGKGPDDTMLVIQRLRRWMEQGRVTQEQILAVSELFEEAEDAGIPSGDSMLAEVVPILQRRAETEAVRDLITTYGKRGDIEDIIRRLVKSRSLGTVDQSFGVRFGIEGFREIERMRQLTRLPTGIEDLDSALTGGLPLGAMGVVIGGSGSGKSMYLSHVGAHGIYNGLNVLYATLELPEAEVLARMTANLTGIDIAAMQHGQLQDAERALLDLQDTRTLGGCLVREFTPHATTVEELRDWKKSVEDTEGQPVHLVVVDYGDKLAAPSESNEYNAGRVVFEGLRVWAVEDRLWLWTGAQATRQGKDKAKRLDLHHVADSMHKVRVADIVITLTPKGEQSEELLYYVAKHRTGPSRIEIGPLPTEFECGRIAPVTRVEDFTDAGTPF